MKSTLSAIALVASVLPSIVSASPLNFERNAEADVEVDIVTALDVVTALATVWATEGAEAAPTTTTTPVAVAETTTVPAFYAGHGHGHKSYTWHQDTTSTTSTSSTPPLPPPPTTTSSTETPPPPPPPTTTEAPTTTAEAPAWTAPPAPPAPTTTWAAPAPAPTVASGPSAYTGDASYDSDNLQVAIINSTNVYRTMFQANAVTWNQSLVDMAVTSANTCNFEHTNAGQNLAAGYGGPEGAVGGWGDEYKTFDFSNPDFTESTGHFTQLVWQDTTTVGCAAKNCPTDGSTSASGWYLICNYFPVGNMLGEFPENVKPMKSS